jgi:hypothetical protein
LRRIEFDWRGDAGLSMLPRFQFEMQMYRHSVASLGVEFSVTEIDNPDLTGSVTYTVLFEVEDGSPESQQMERALKMLAARVAPVTLYPFCREALVSMAHRAGLMDFVPPITNVGALWTPEELDLPDPPSDDDPESVDEVG